MTRGKDSAEIVNFLDNFFKNDYRDFIKFTKRRKRTGNIGMYGENFVLYYFLNFFCYNVFNCIMELDEVHPCFEDTFSLLETVFVFFVKSWKCVEFPFINVMYNFLSNKNFSFSVRYRDKIGKILDKSGIFDLMIDGISRNPCLTLSPLLMYKVLRLMNANISLIKREKLLLFYFNINFVVLHNIRKPNSAEKNLLNMDNFFLLLIDVKKRVNINYKELETLNLFKIYLNNDICKCYFENYILKFCKSKFDLCGNFLGNSYNNYCIDLDIAHFFISILDRADYFELNRDKYLAQIENFSEDVRIIFFLALPKSFFTANSDKLFLFVYKLFTQKFMMVFYSNNCIYSTDFNHLLDIPGDKLNKKRKEVTEVFETFSPSIMEYSSYADYFSDLNIFLLSSYILFGIYNESDKWKSEVNSALDATKITKDYIGLEFSSLIVNACLTYPNEFFNDLFLDNIDIIFDPINFCRLSYKVHKLLEYDSCKRAYIVLKLLLERVLEGDHSQITINAICSVFESITISTETPEEHIRNLFYMFFESKDKYYNLEIVKPCAIESFKYYEFNKLYNVITRIEDNFIKANLSYFSLLYFERKLNSSSIYSASNQLYARFDHIYSKEKSHPIYIRFHENEKEYSKLYNLVIKSDPGVAYDLILELQPNKKDIAWAIREEINLTQNYPSKRPLFSDKTNSVDISYSDTITEDGKDHSDCNASCTIFERETSSTNISLLKALYNINIIAICLRDSKFSKRGGVSLFDLSPDDADRYIKSEKMKKVIYELFSYLNNSKFQNYKLANQVNIVNLLAFFLSMNDLPKFSSNYVAKNVMSLLCCVDSIRTMFSGLFILKKLLNSKSDFFSSVTGEIFANFFTKFMFDSRFGDDIINILFKYMDHFIKNKDAYHFIIDSLYKVGKCSIYNQRISCEYFLEKYFGCVDSLLEKTDRNLTDTFHTIFLILVKLYCVKNMSFHRNVILCLASPIPPKIFLDKILNTLSKLIEKHSDKLVFSKQILGGYAGFIIETFINNTYIPFDIKSSNRLLYNLFSLNKSIIEKMVPMLCFNYDKIFSKKLVFKLTNTIFKNIDYPNTSLTSVLYALNNVPSFLDVIFNLDFESLADTYEHSNVILQYQFVFSLLTYYPLQNIQIPETFEPLNPEHPVSVMQFIINYIFKANFRNPDMLIDLLKSDEIENEDFSPKVSPNLLILEYQEGCPIHEFIYFPANSKTLSSSKEYIINSIIYEADGIYKTLIRVSDSWINVGNYEHDNFVLNENSIDMCSYFSDETFFDLMIRRYNLKTNAVLLIYTSEVDKIINFSCPFIRDSVSSDVTLLVYKHMFTEKNYFLLYTNIAEISDNVKVCQKLIVHALNSAKNNTEILNCIIVDVCEKKLYTKLIRKYINCLDKEIIIYIHTNTEFKKLFDHLIKKSPKYVSRCLITFVKYSLDNDPLCEHLLSSLETLLEIYQESGLKSEHRDDMHFIIFESQIFLPKFFTTGLRITRVIEILDRVNLIDKILLNEIHPAAILLVNLARKNFDFDREISKWKFESNIERSLTIIEDALLDSYYMEKLKYTDISDSVADLLVSKAFQPNNSARTDRLLYLLRHICSCNSNNVNIVSKHLLRQLELGEHIDDKILHHLLVFFKNNSMHMNHTIIENVSRLYSGFFCSMKLKKGSYVYANNESEISVEDTTKKLLEIVGFIKVFRDSFFKFVGEVVFIKLLRVYLEPIEYEYQLNVIQKVCSIRKDAIYQSHINRSWINSVIRGNIKKFNYYLKKLPKHEWKGDRKVSVKVDMCTSFIDLCFADVTRVFFEGPKAPKLVFKVPDLHKYNISSVKSDGTTAHFKDHKKKIKLTIAYDEQTFIPFFSHSKIEIINKVPCELIIRMPDDLVLNNCNDDLLCNVYRDSQCLITIQKKDCLIKKQSGYTFFIFRSKFIDNCAYIKNMVIDFNADDFKRFFTSMKKLISFMIRHNNSFRRRYLSMILGFIDAGNPLLVSFVKIKAEYTLHDISTDFRTMLDLIFMEEPRFISLDEFSKFLSRTKDSRKLYNEETLDRVKKFLVKKWEVEYRKSMVLINIPKPVTEIRELQCKVLNHIAQHHSNVELTENSDSSFSFSIREHVKSFKNEGFRTLSY